MKNTGNPFILAGYAGKKWFCNREEEIKKITDHVKNERNITLYGWRRMGKTAMLHRWVEDSMFPKGTELLYVDLLTTSNFGEALRTITKAVYEKFGKAGNGIKTTLQQLFSAIGVSIQFDAFNSTPQISFGLNSSSMPERSLNALGKFLSERKKKMVIVLDEFQQIVNYEEKNAESYFRGWMQEFPRLRFIFCGSHRNMMVSMFTEKKRPFYKCTQLMSLEPVPLDKYTGFIQNHFTDSEKIIDETTIRHIYSWSRGQTYCIQLICNYLYGNSRKVSDADLTGTYEKLFEQEKPVFANYQKILTQLQWNVLVAVAKEEPLKNYLGNEFITKYKLGAASSVKTAIETLRKNELIIEDKGFQYVHDVLLARWLGSL